MSLGNAMLGCPAGRSCKLKRAIAREIFRLLTTPVAVPGVDDLRPLYQAKNISVTAAANQLGVWA